jgi:energy-coupling factor transport system ATP-binding protein
MARGSVVRDDSPEAIFNLGSELGQWGLETPAVFQLSEMLRASSIHLPREIFSQTSPSSYEDPLGAASSTPEGKIEAPDHVVAERLSHTYDRGLPTEQQALSNIDLHIKKGQCTAIIGSTGSGKTTLAEHFMGLLKPSSGRILIDGRDLRAEKKNSETRRKIGLVFQFPELQFFAENVYDEIAYGPRNLGLSEGELQQQVEEAMDRVGLSPEIFSRRSPFTLSAGEQRLVAIASILSMGPEGLILDEPTAGLDSKGVGRILELIRRCSTGGMTIILISHHLDLVARVSSWVVVLSKGEVVLEGSPRHIFQKENLLTSMGLDVPEPIKIMKKLRRKGWRVRTDALTLEEARDEILTFVRSGGVSCGTQNGKL